MKKKARKPNCKPLKTIGPRHLACSNYDYCLSLTVSNRWPGFSCRACPQAPRRLPGPQPENEPTLALTFKDDVGKAAMITLAEAAFESGRTLEDLAVELIANGAACIPLDMVEA